MALQRSIFSFGNGPAKVSIGGKEFVVIAGPCSIESHEQFSHIAHHVRRAGAAMLRGGIFKMRTHAKSFQGLGEQAYPIAREIKRQTGMTLISEITDPRQIGPMGEVIDMFQVGARNMHNYELLKELGKTQVPVMIKRGFSALVEEWVAAADYVRNAGNPHVVLCERGIRTFEKVTRNTLDLSAVAWARANTDLPVFVDPSHGTGVRNLIGPMCLAAAAAGADGLLLEVHHAPESALSDGKQALTLQDFDKIMADLKRMLPALDRKLHAIEAMQSECAESAGPVECLQ